MKTTVLEGRSERKKPLRIPRHRWEDNIKIDLREVDCDPGHWIDLSEDRVRCLANARTVMNLQFHYKPIY